MAILIDEANECLLSVDKGQRGSLEECTGNQREGESSHGEI